MEEKIDTLAGEMLRGKKRGIKLTKNFSGGPGGQLFKKAPLVTFYLFPGIPRAVGGIFL
jgi:hypothetical protein